MGEERRGNGGRSKGEERGIRKGRQGTEGDMRLEEEVGKGGRRNRRSVGQRRGRRGEKGSKELEEDAGYAKEGK